VIWSQLCLGVTPEIVVTSVTSRNLKSRAPMRAVRQRSRSTQRRGVPFAWSPRNSLPPR